MNIKIIITSFIFLSILSISGVYSQQIDSTQIGKEYPYILPFLGKKAYAKGYELPKPFGAMLTTVFNKQGLILENFELALGEENTPPGTYFPLNGILDFGPSEGRVTTLNARLDAWILPFLSVGGYYGKVWGEQTISFSLLGSDLIESTTDIEGKYYGLNLLAVAPVGPVVITADYSWAWTTNERLDNPVLVNISGIRIIKRFKSQKKGRYFAVWTGAQFQKLDNRTSGNIGFDEALGVSDEDKQKIDDTWDSFKNNEITDGNGDYYDDLTVGEKIRYEATYNLIKGVVDTTVYYKFDKKLEYNWNMLLGLNFQLNPDWQFRTEYGFLKSKQQFMFSVNYRFGL